VIQRAASAGHAVFVADRGQRGDGGRAQQVLVEQRHHQRRHARIVGLAERLDGGKGEEEIVGSGNLRERIDGFRGADGAQRFDGVEADVFVRVLERRDQLGGGFLGLQLAGGRGPRASSGWRPCPDSSCTSGATTVRPAAINTRSAR
jgi:hypothetical protein